MKNTYISAAISMLVISVLIILAGIINENDKIHKLQNQVFDLKVFNIKHNGAFYSDIKEEISAEVQNQEVWSSAITNNSGTFYMWEGVIKIPVLVTNYIQQ